jgi:carnitine O-acetyltransferase
MTKAFLHGRTEAIRTVQPTSVEFVKVPAFFLNTRVSLTPPTADILLRGDSRAKDRRAAQGVPSARQAHERVQPGPRPRPVRHPTPAACCFSHAARRHLYALYCLLQREREDADRPPSPAASTDSGYSGHANGSGNGNGYNNKPPLPAIFTDPGWSLLSTSILSTSNCGNPALRLFGFGPVAADGYGIGYIIKDEGLSVYVRLPRCCCTSRRPRTDTGARPPRRCASSKHLQTRRFLDTLQSYLQDAQRLLVQLHLAANPAAEPFVDHAGVLRDSRTGRPINGRGSPEAKDEYDTDMIRTSPSRSRRVGGGVLMVSRGLAGYSFFDSGDVDLLGRRKRAPAYYNTGTRL